MSVRILAGDCRAVLPTLPAESVHCVVTSPPYWGLRDYGVAGQLGLESDPETYVARMVEVFRGVRRVLRDDGTLWLNMGDSYGGSPTSGGVTTSTLHEPTQSFIARAGMLPDRRAAGLKPKNLVGMPWRLAFALQADGWFLRADIVWAKPNPMPESVTDRPTKAHEYVFLLTKSARYFYDADAVREPAVRAGDFPGGDDERTRHVLEVRSHARFNGTVPSQRNLRSVWTIPSAPFPEAHFATFPPALASRCIQAGTSAKGCCGACGAPWARVVEHEGGSYAARQLAGVGGPYNGKPQDYQTCGTSRAITRGWQPSCACEAPVVPCTVLDPFGGSGTVGMVAEQLGRHSILIELSPAYVRMAAERTAQLGLFAQERAAG